MTVSLGMHTVGNEDLETENDAQVTRRVSRVTIHNEFNHETFVKNKLSIQDQIKINFIRSFFFKFILLKRIRIQFSHNFVILSRLVFY